MSFRKIGGGQDYFSWGVLFVALVAYLLPYGTKLKITPPLAGPILYPLRGIAVLRTALENTGRENRRLEQVGAELAVENARLKSLLAMTSAVPPSTSRIPGLVPALIIARDLTSLKRFFTIGVGSNQGVKTGTPVLVPEGIVGRVVATSSHQSLLQTLYDPDFRVAVMNSRSREIAVARPEREALVLDYVSQNADFQTGDTIITSGLGGVFPKGLKVGVVVEVPRTPEALFVPVVVKPFVNIARIERVFVLMLPGDTGDEWLENLRPLEIKMPD